MIPYSVLRQSNTRRLILLAGLFLASCIPAHLIAAAEFIPIPGLEVANDVSANGSIVVGGIPADKSVVGPRSTITQPALWTRSGGVQLLATAPGVWLGSASAISRDGSTVIANFPYSFPQQQAPYPPQSQALWTQSTGLVFNSRYSVTYSDFGPGSKTLFGNYAFYPGGPLQPAFESPTAGWVGLDVPSYSLGYITSYTPTAVSADDTKVVGTINYGNSNTLPYLWDAQAGYHIFQVPSGYINGTANAISDDGTVVVGTISTEYTIYRWTQAGGMQLITNFGATPKMSADGSIIVSVATRASNVDPGGRQDKPLIWDAAHGVRLLQDVLQQAGANFSGYELISVNAITPDGLTFVGQALPIVDGETTEFPIAYVATLAVPEPALAAEISLLIAALPMLSRRRRMQTSGTA